jgi:hypothetical protein
VQEIVAAAVADQDNPSGTVKAAAMLHLHPPTKHQVSAVGHRRAAVVAHALPKRRRQPGRRRPGSKAGGGEEGKQFSDGACVG